MCHRGSCVLPRRDEGDRTRKTQRQRETDVTAATHNQGKGEIQEPVGRGGGGWEELREEERDRFNFYKIWRVCVNNSCHSGNGKEKL